MALTTEQEEKVAQIIEAFENGKRLSDLPNVSGTNPYNLFCEVLDEDGESKKAALATLLPYTEEQSSYGVQFDTAVSTPTCTRVGSSTKAAPFRTVCVAVCLTMMATWLNTLTLAIGRGRCVTVHEVRSWWRFLFTTASLRLTAQN